MKQIKIFNHPELGKLRCTMDVNEVPLFGAIDIARMLDFRDPGHSVRDHCKKLVLYPAPTTSGVQDMNFIQKSDVYRLIIRSASLKADIFLEWFLEVILPSFKKKDEQSQHHSPKSGAAQIGVDCLPRDNSYETDESLMEDVLNLFQAEHLLQQFRTPLPRRSRPMFRPKQNNKERPKEDVHNDLEVFVKAMRAISTLDNVQKRNKNKGIGELSLDTLFPIRILLV